MGTVPKPVQARLAHSIKHTANTAAVHGQQIVNLQSQIGLLANLPAAGVSPVATAGATYSQAQVNAIVAAVNALISSLTAAGLLG